METLKFDLKSQGNKFKILNATNGGPQYRRHAVKQSRENKETYKAARFPYSRNHDSALCAGYGGQYSHDITGIFPNFDADVNDPASYDFACTDEDIAKCYEVGTAVFYRLGQSIEHQIKKHATIPPKDFKKWAEICEHVIRHYNEGWADGFHYNIEYWEIWNEPDLDADDSPNKRTWGGNRAQFIDFYAITAKHLKKCFPNLKIGGPAFAWNEEWLNAFLSEMQKRNVSIDFFSWHIYCSHPDEMLEKAERIQNILNQYGYNKTENILDEWNYLKGWTDEFVYTLEAIHGIRGAIFTHSCICSAQHSVIDMLMYYDTRPSVWNGAFDYYSLKPLKGYYPLYWYGMFYDMEKEIQSENNIDDIFSLCGVDKEGKVLATISYYVENDDVLEEKEIKIDFGKSGKYEIYLLDKDHDGELIDTTGDTTFTLKPLSALLIKEV